MARRRLSIRRVAIFDYLMLAPALVWIIIFLLIPIVIVVLMSFYTLLGVHIEPIFTLSNYVTIFTSAVHLSILAFTLKLSFTILAVCLGLAYPAAYYLALKIKSEAFKTLLILLMLIPFWIDWTIRTMAWYPMLGVTGLMNTAMIGLGVFQKPSELLLMSEFSATLVMIQSYLLFMIAPIFLSMIKIDPGLLQAAESLGANRLKSFYHITFKMSLPGVIIGCIFVFVMSMADFATPRLLGGTVQTIGLSVAYNMGVLNWPLASAFATILIAITLAVIYVMLKIVDVKGMVF